MRPRLQAFEPQLRELCCYIIMTLLCFARNAVEPSPDGPQVDSHVERQPLFSEPKRVQDRYAAGEDSGDDAGKVRNMQPCLVRRAATHILLPMPKCTG